MKKKGNAMKTLKKYISILLCIVLFISGIGLNSLIIYAAEEPTHTGTVKEVTPYLNVRQSPEQNFNYVGKLYSGDSVTIYGEAVAGGNYNWYKIGFGNGFGYVATNYIINVKEIPKYDYDADFETNLNNQGFPESYKTLLRKLHASHPNWIFTADHLSMTWEEAVRNESVVGKSLVEKGSKASWKSMMQYAYDWQKGSYVPYDSGGWVTAERDVVEYYMEPRNFLNESYIYMFLDQSYNPSIQNKAGLQKILNGTFMEGAFPEDTYATYADVIMAAAEHSGVSPYVLAASIIIEQGVQGQGGSISGTVAGYEGYYNYFNIRAYAEGGYSAVQYGLLYAKGEGDLGRPWNTRAKSIIGGAEHYANGYVKRGQDNLYYKKFNVIVPDFYYNQYMTNVQGAYLETGKLKNAYSSVNTDAQLTFAIPVFKQMPETNNTALPTSSGANNYYLTSITVDGAVLAQASATQGVLYTNEYEMIVDSYISKINISATAPSGASVRGTGEIQLNTGMNKITLTVTAASGKKADYIVSVFRKEGADNPPPVPEPTIQSSYNVGSVVSGISEGTDAQTFLSKFGVKNGTAKLFNASNVQKTSGTVATGDKVSVYNNKGTLKYTYSIVIYGDTNGDGKISIIDLARVQKHLLEVNKLSSSYSLAADVNRDGKISILDLARVQKHLLELTKITQ
ncbi:MAG: SH3 domain-containing protein [Clostridia bacterium]|nr:SH3 domain-containing protein [Clostridia bacterium]